jgi:hypothetical protein
VLFKMKKLPEQLLSLVSLGLGLGVAYADIYLYYKSHYTFSVSHRANISMHLGLVEKPKDRMSNVPTVELR